MQEYHDQVRQLVAHEPDLARELTELRTLEHVLDWLRDRGIPFASLDLVTQDEYSHDLVLPFGPGGRHLSFGMT